MIFGVCISVKPWEVRCSLKNCETAALSFMMAWFAGVRRSIILHRHSNQSSVAQQWLSSGASVGFPKRASGPGCIQELAKG